ncbi:MAG TPA: ABC transporter permease [Bacteroidales bacterium]|nr:ABC transporter permease [Bacteroidales bacterium]
MKYVLKELLRHPWRTAFSIAGYAVASLFLMAVLSVASGNKKDAFGILKSTGTHFIIYIPTDQNCCISNKADVSVIAEGVNSMMIDSNLLRTIRNTEGVRDAAPCLLFRIFQEKFGSYVTVAGIDTSGVATKSNSCARTNVISGRFISGNPGEIVAEEAFATAHNIEVGDTLNLFGTNLVLTGIVNSGIKPVKGDFYLPIASARDILKNKLTCTARGFDMNIILVEAADSRQQDAVMGRIRNMMYRFNVSSYNCYQPASSVMSVVGNSSAGIALLVFLFLLVFSAKTQLASLMERFREIGILKSLGWSDTRLSLQAVILSVVHSVAGVSVGIIAGIMLIQVLKMTGSSLFTYMEKPVNFSTLLLLYSLSLAGALFASLFPVIRIYSSKAGDILRTNM